MSIRNQSTNALFWKSVQNYGDQILSLVVFIVLARILERKDFGLVVLATFFTAFARLFVQIGTGPAIIQRKELEDDYIHTAFWLQVMLGAVVSAIVFVMAWPLARLSLPSDGNPKDLNTIFRIIQILSVSFFFNALGATHGALLARNFRFKILAVRGMTVSSLWAVIGISAALLNYGVWSLVIMQMFKSIAGSLSIWFVAGYYPRLVFSRKYLQEHMKFTSSMSGTNIVTFVNNRSQDFLIGRFYGLDALALFNNGVRFFRQISDGMFQSLNAVLLPIFSRMQDEKSRLKKAVIRIERVKMLACMPVFAGMSLLAPEIILLTIGPKWVDSAPVLRWAGLLGINWAFLTTMDRVAVACGKPHWITGIKTFNAVTNVLMFVTLALLISSDDALTYIYAVIAAMTIRAYVQFPLRIWILKKLIGLNTLDAWLIVRGPLIATIFMTGTVILCHQIMPSSAPHWQILLVCVPVGAAAYASVIIQVSYETSMEFLELLQHLVRRGNTPRKAVKESAA